MTFQKSGATILVLITNDHEQGGMDLYGVNRDQAKMSIAVVAQSSQNSSQPYPGNNPEKISRDTTVTLVAQKAPGNGPG